MAVFAKAYMVAKRVLAALVFRSTKFQAITFLVQRIGHLAMEPDLYIKERLLGTRRTDRDAIVVRRELIVNKVLWDYWLPHLPEASRVRRCDWPVVERVIDRTLRTLAIHPDYVVGANTTAQFPAITRRWGLRPPILSLLPEHVEAGWDVLERFGIARGSWFVCFHVREQGYAMAESHHEFRNATISNYFAAMDAIAERGGWCIRMGDASMTRIEPRKNVFDYARSTAKSEFMDVFLCAACHYFVASGSGLSAVASVFGRNVVATNMAPLSHILPYNPMDVGIAKLVWSENRNRLLSFSEIFGSSTGNFRDAKDFADARLSVVENTPDDILAAAIEGLEIADGSAEYMASDEVLQSRFKALMSEGHYSFGAPSRVGRAYLTKYAHLF